MAFRPQKERILVCEGCGYVLATSVIEGQVTEPVIRCPQCRNFDLSPSVLTRRQIEVVKELTEGRPIRLIAARLCVCAKTIESHRHDIYHRLKVNDLANLTKLALRMGLTDPEVQFVEIEHE